MSGKRKDLPIGKTFTFQNVSISTWVCVLRFLLRDALHSKMYLFLHDTRSAPSLSRLPLHSKMYLFLLISVDSRMGLVQLYIPKCIYFYNIVDCMFTLRTSFTFQNVSISTDFIDESHENGKALHSKMYLFLLVDDFCNPVYSILYIPKCIYFYCYVGCLKMRAFPLYIPKCIYFYKCNKHLIMICHHTLHSKMYLFLPIAAALARRNKGNFTFQNVSISTKTAGAASRQRCTLHSKMYLFLQGKGNILSA